LDGLTRGGYKLVYTETPTDYFKNSEARRKVADLSYSLGMIVSMDGRVNDVLWQGPAFQNGLTVGTQIVAVNGTAFDADRLKGAIKDSKQSGAVIELVVKNADRFRTVRFDYHDGLRYPRLERVQGTPARLDEILTPRN
jgi:predicted metalloprotease with PDZ domain